MAKASKQFVVCIDNAGYEASLESRKIYECVEDAESGKLGLLRIIDESSEDYLFPKKNFALIDVPKPVQRAFSHAA